MSSEEQAAQAAVQAQAQAASQANQQSATRTRGLAIEYRLEASSDDAQRAYSARQWFPIFFFKFCFTEGISGGTKSTRL
jgi:hypothetical protein